MKEIQTKFNFRGIRFHNGDKIIFEALGIYHVYYNSDIKSIEIDKLPYDEDLANIIIKYSYIR